MDNINRKKVEVIKDGEAFTCIVQCTNSGLPIYVVYVLSSQLEDITPSDELYEMIMKKAEVTP